MKRIKYIVAGKVQQVGYRYYCQREAIVLGLTGFAKNLPNAAVHVEAQGEESALQIFGEIVRRGPREAEVISVDETAIEPHSKDQGFSVGWEDKPAS